ncbi:hypothetical protein C8R43DRAFT_1130155 [Mycena crocata]|nr:hypothetical protein C8R43DRAFT_1130155 [Mycena crocata]
MPASRSQPGHPPSRQFNRFTPTLRIATPKGPNLADARLALRQWNDIGVPATWCPLSNDWVPWVQPMRVLKTQKKLVPVAASGYHKIKNLLPPRCPHSFVNARNSQMTLHLNQVHDETREKANFYRADSHNCGMIVFIPDIEKYRSEYITTQDQRELFDQLYAFDDDDDVDNALASTSSSNSSPSSSAEAAEVEMYLLHGEPRLPRMRDLPPAMQGPIKSFFNERVSEARKTCDKRLIFNLHFEDFKRFPLTHPLAQKPIHPLMKIYDGTDNPACLIRAFSNLEHIDSHIGRAIREYHSPIGIPDQAWETIIDNTIPCNSCECYYSLNGYNSHVVDDLCTMASPLRGVSYFEPRLPSSVDVRTYPNGYIIPHMEDFLDTPSGVAFMEWNSRIGVPGDVWALLATSGVADTLKTKGHMPIVTSIPHVVVIFVMDLYKIYQESANVFNYPLNGVIALPPYANDRLLQHYLMDPLPAGEHDCLINRPRPFPSFIGQPPKMVNNIPRPVYQPINKQVFYGLSEGQQGPKHKIQIGQLTVQPPPPPPPPPPIDNTELVYCSRDEIDMLKILSRGDGISQIDLLKIHHEAELEAHYPLDNLLTKVPYAPAGLLTSWLNRPVGTGDLQPLSDPIIFSGYLGDPISIHMSRDQLNVVNDMEFGELQLLPFVLIP